ncbi:hypothetical protein B6D60_04980 [candidate division KSB1 bacterium 4484_87]|nr:MAG: hypothetical protein B6D60_04980 [candidate division KSB1 bacterium 4484_87]
MRKFPFLFIVLLVIFFVSIVSYAGGRWYNFYDQALKLMQQKQYAAAVEKFNQALKTKSKDTKKIKTYGMHFISYFPHREKGICLFYLGQTEQARNELQLSIRQQYSQRAQDFLTKINGGVVPPPAPPVQLPPKKEEIKVKPLPPKPIPQSTSPKRVGERMGIAVLPFESKGLGQEMGEINIVEQMMTTFYSTDRFKLFERTQLEKILEEQKLGMTGVIDASTAAEIGKGIGVDAIVLGSVTRAGSNIAIDARLIDTETAEIITAQDDMCKRTTIPELKAMINRLAQKIVSDLPLVEGYVIGVKGDDLTLDFGLDKGVKKGMKCIVYSEGREIIHPITKKVLGKETEELGEVRLMQVYPQFSIAKVIRSQGGVFEIGNKVITK